MTQAPAEFRVWTNKPGASPEPWLAAHMAGGRESNGTFLINTPRGQARVHVGYVVIERKGSAWTRHPDEAAAFLRGLDEEEADYSKLPKSLGGAHPKDAVADVADRSDDTDEITARIRAQKGVRIVSGGIGEKRRETAPQGRESTTKEIGRQPARKLPYPAPLGSMPTIEWLHVNRLSVDAAYQRSTDNDASRRLITSIAAKFDWRLCAPLVVSRRPDGSLAIIDGQHRWTAASRRGDIPQLPCCVFSYEGPEEEARMFIASNRARKPMNRLDDFHAALAAADDDALEINRLVTEAGLKVARNTASAAWGPGEIAFTAAIATAIRKHGPVLVTSALTMIAEAFPDDRLGHGGSIFSGLMKVLASPPAPFDRDRLFRAMLTFKAEQWGDFVQGLKGGDTRAQAMKTAMLEAYDSVGATAEQAT
ncbi:MAG: hypothetical protein JWQ03_3087 [Variovorax sp.]|nr:hypothetical protein [Variovorax sp.]